MEWVYVGFLLIVSMLWTISAQLGRLHHLLSTRLPDQRPPIQALKDLV